MNRKVAQRESGLEYAALSDIGLRRNNNQDSLAIQIAATDEAREFEGHLFIVADGMGAHAAGELASKMAVEAVPANYQRHRHRPPAEAISKASEEANSQIHARGQASDEFRGMGTTLSTLVLLPQGALVAHVGDSRVYRLRGDRFEQLTFDHTLVWEVCSLEDIAEGDIPGYIPKNVVTRCVGPHAEVEVDLEGPFPLAENDLFLLTSDGLHGIVENREMGTILRCLPVEEAIQVLIDLALLRGGPDNITGLAVRVTELPEVKQPIEQNPRPKKENAPSHRMAILSVAAIVLLAAGGWMLQGLAVAMAAALLGGAVAGMLALFMRQPDGAPFALEEESSLGKGPYTSFDCEPNEAFVAHLSGIMKELRSHGDAQNWNIDWSEFERCDEEAQSLARAEDYVQAISQRCRAISAVTCQVRPRSEA
jgi:protein phosphatase